MSSLEIYEFSFDDFNIEEFARHGIRWEQVDQVLDNTFATQRNRKQRRATYLVIGKDNGGRFISLPIEPTHESTLWRPVTAYPSKYSEIADYYKVVR